MEEFVSRNIDCCNILWYKKKVLGSNLTMNAFRWIIMFICYTLQVVSYVSHPKKGSLIIQNIDRTTGEVIVIDPMIQKYEKEHQQLFKEEIGNETHLQWPALYNKDLSNYCKKFLQHSVPRRKKDSATAFRIEKVLHYKKENKGITSAIVILKCKVISPHSLSYYLTRAPEVNCVYALKYTCTKAGKLFTIINKYCDFEKSPLKRKRVEIVGLMHRITGQPIAKDKYLMEYEMEHQELVRSEGGTCIGWPYTMKHENLHSYCYQYLEECIPNRSQGSISGLWKTDKLNYEKVKTNEIIWVTIVICRPSNASKRNYYITRALETNCVFALIRKSRTTSYLVIVFKYCDFENQSSGQTISRDYNNIEKNVIQKTEVKEEILNPVETLQPFS